MSSTDDINFKPTEAMAAEAQRGLDWRDEFNRGGTEVGIARGRDIANRRNLSPDTVKRMNSYFARHEVDKKGEGWSPGEPGYPSNGRIAWALWGGDSGKSWASARLRQIEAREKAGSVVLPAEFAAANQPDHSDGIMVCVRTTKPERFAIEGGTPVEELHVTLAYFGSVNDEEWTESAREQIAEVLKAEIADRAEPLDGNITAVTTFDLAGEEDPPLVLLIDAPGLGHLRDQLVHSVEAALGEGQEVKKNHDFMPHMTVAYGASEEEYAFAKSLVGESVHFKTIELVWGEECSVYDLGSAIPDSEVENGLRFGGTSDAFVPQEGDSMPYEIVEDHPDCESSDPYAVVKADDGELMGCHETRQSAEDQITALDIAEADDGEMATEGDPLAIVIGDEMTNDERLAAVDEFLAAANGGGSGGGGDDEEDDEEEEEDDSESGPEVEVEVEIEEGDDDEEDDDEEDMASAGSGVVNFKAVGVHDTPTTDSAWDGPANETRVKTDQDEAYYRRIYAWQDPDGDVGTKTAWRFIHHEVDGDGNPGPANLRACSTGIGVLNGARGGTTIPDADKAGVYRHLAAHLRAGDMEPPELDGMSVEEMAATLDAMASEAEATFGALPSHDSPTTDPPTFEGWNGNEAAKRARSGETAGYYGRIYAWQDPNKDPGSKTAYKFIHHAVSESGEPGAAVVWAVHSAIAVIDDSTIPTSDYRGVYNHLAKHLRDAGVDDIPELGEDVASIDEVRAAIAHVRSKYLAMVEAAAMTAADIAGVDDTALVGEVMRRWFESVARSKGAETAEEIEADAEFASDDEDAEASTDCPCHKGVLEDGATHTEGCPFAQIEEAEMAEHDDDEQDDSSEIMPDEDMADVVVGNFGKGDYEWEGVLIVEGLPSGDGRMIEAGGLTWRDLPVPLMLQTVNAAGHDGAVIAGSIHEIERQGHEIIGRGYFDSGVNGQEAKRLLDEGTMRGVSADIDSVVAELRDENGDDVSMEDALFGDPGNVMEVLVEGRIMGATMTPFPAFQEAHLRVIEGSDVEEDAALVASGAEVRGEVWRFTSPHPLVGRGQESYVVESLVASAGDTPEVPSIPVNPPLAWFTSEDEDLDPDMPFTVFANGRIYGLVARWGACHIGFRDRCVQVPRSSDGYGYFRSKNTLTAEGELVATGPVYADTVHPDLKLRASDAQAFYAHTGCAVADVALYENEYGILAAGAVRPDVPEEAVRRLRGSDVSPDWRNIKGNLEVVGLLSVNVSGFPSYALAASAGEGEEPAPVESMTPRGRWNSVTGEFDSLVAAGAVHRCNNCGSTGMNDEAVLAILEMLNEHSARLDDITELVRPYRMERLATRLAELGIVGDASTLDD